MDLTRASKKMKTEAWRQKISKFEAYFPHFEKQNHKIHEKTKRKPSFRKNRCESVQSTRTSCKRSTTPVYSKVEPNVSEVCHRKDAEDIKRHIRRFVRTDQKSPKSFMIRHKKFQKSSDSSYDNSFKIHANRPISSISRRVEEKTKEKVKDLNSYFEEFYEKSKILLQKFEQNMKKGKILT